MQYTLYILGIFLWILSIFTIEADKSLSETILIIGWIVFVGGMVVDRIDKLEEKLTKK